MAGKLVIPHPRSLRPTPRRSKVIFVRVKAELYERAEALAKQQGFKSFSEFGEQVLTRLVDANPIHRPGK